MAANQILKIVDELAKSRGEFVSKQQLFTEKIANEDRLSHNDKPKDMSSYDFAYRNEYSKINTKTRDGEPAEVHQLIPYIDETYEEIKEVSKTINAGIDLVNYIEDMIKEHYVISNSRLEAYKDEYDKANSKYKGKIDVNSATQILKMDTYDRNIEENFFIMYYLISYGVIGYFMYKLLKM